MTKKEFAARIKELDGKYRTTTLPEAAIIAYNHIKDYPAADLDTAIGRLLLRHSNPNRPPSMADLVREVQEVGKAGAINRANQREADARREARDMEAGISRALDPERQKGIMLAACQLTTDLLTHRVKKHSPEHIARLEALAELSPAYQGELDAARKAAGNG